jgi:hypothetical protein
METYLESRIDRRHEHAFFLSMSVSMAICIFVGFAPTFYLKPWFPEAQQFAAPELIHYFHGLVFSLWMLLQIAQPGLITSGRVRLHRQLGSVGVGLAVVMVVLGVNSSLIGAKREGGFTGVSMGPLEFLAIPLLEMFLFAVLVASAVGFRRSPQTHKRLMVLATTLLVGAGIVRLPLEGVLRAFDDAVGLHVVFVAALVAWDIMSDRRIHPATLIAGIPVAGYLAFANWLGSTQLWLAFAAAITSSPS